MKLKFLFLALFVAGVAASVALAAPSDHGRGKSHNDLVAHTGTTATTATTDDDDHEGDDHHGKAKDKATRCRQVELRGTLAPTALSVKIDRASGPGRSLVGKTATLAAGSRVRVSARLCPDGTLQLRELKTEKPRETPPTTTTAPTTTGATTTAATTTTG